MLRLKFYKVWNANTTTGAQVGPAIDVSAATKVGVLLRLAGHGSGNTVFSFKAGMEEGVGGAGDTATPTMSTFNYMIDNVTTTNAQNTTHVASKTLSANGDAILWVDYNAIIRYLEIDINTTTDGSASAWIVMQVDE